MVWVLGVHVEEVEPGPLGGVLPDRRRLREAVGVWQALEQPAATLDLPVHAEPPEHLRVDREPVVEERAFQSTHLPVRLLPLLVLARGILHGDLERDGRVRLRAERLPELHQGLALAQAHLVDHREPDALVTPRLQQVGQGGLERQAEGFPPRALVAVRDLHDPGRLVDGGAHPQARRRRAPLHRQAEVLAKDAQARGDHLHQAREPHRTARLA
mmetsp:Transcript_46049/g.121662  ORF Transcript_46049/g.121662 Transcript_46049/m.121662 type:complete len:214 (+) Transcript_46049:609-1250(+)